MAYLSRLLGEESGRQRGERAQIILVAAFALAAIFVTLTLVVNSAIFTENLATRGETGGADDALTGRAVAQSSIGVVVEGVNRNNNSDESLQVHNLSAGVTDVSQLLGKQYAAEGAIVTVGPMDPTRIENGTRIVDRTAGGSTFAGASGATNWTVFTNLGTDETRAFVLNISYGSVVDGSDGFGGARGDEFYVNVTDGSDTWHVNVTERSGEFTVGVLAPDGDSSRCSVDGSPDAVQVDLTEGTVAGEPCPALRFGRGVDGNYDITYNNSDLVSGNYSLVVNQDGHTNPELASGPGTANPYATHAVYELTVRYRYDGPETAYGTDVRVAPGEP